MNRRAVVTGLGVVCSLGSDTDEFWRRCLDGETVVRPIPGHWSDYSEYKSTLWSPLPGEDALFGANTRVERAQTDPVSLLAASAASEALQAAGLEPELRSKRANTYRIRHLEPARAGVFMGTGIGGARSFLHNHAFQVLSRTRREVADITAATPPDAGGRLAAVQARMVHPPRFNPFCVSMLMPNAVSAFLGVKFGLQGPNLSYAIACASGTVAIGHASRAILGGEVDLALAGGSEFLDDHYGGIFRGFDIAGTLLQNCEHPPTANRPFDQDRSGFLFAQGGAGVLVLESLEHARRRGAEPLAEILGYAESFDASNMMSPEDGGAQIERMIRGALLDAECEPDDIDYVNPHGTGTRSNDEVESGVIQRVFGRRPLISATKSLLGHTIGASGALEALACVLTLRSQRVHPCVNLERPVRDLNFARRTTPARVRKAFSQSFAFGGHNAGLVFGTVE